MTAELVARCDNVIESNGIPCTGVLRYRWGMSQAACDTCGAWCGIAVADWLRVEPTVGACIPFEDEHVPYRYRQTGDAFCRLDGESWPCRALATEDAEVAR